MPLSFFLRNLWQDWQRHAPLKKMLVTKRWDGCYCEIPRMCWTSRRSISLHPGKNGGRSKVAQNSKVTMPRFLDTSSTTQVAQIMVRHRRPSGSSRTKFVWTPTCRPLVGKTFLRKCYWDLAGKKVPNWECFLFTENVDDWTEAEYGSHVEEIDEEMLTWTNQHQLSTMYSWDALNVNVNRTKLLLSI